MPIMHTLSNVFSFCPSFCSQGGGGTCMHYLANVPGHGHFWLRTPPTPPGISTIWLMSHGMSTFWLSARYANNIRIAFLSIVNLWGNLDGS